MARVICTIEEIEIEAEDGRMVTGVEATCTKCKNTGQAFGTHQGSVTRALMQVKETCPMRFNKRNFYTEG